MTQNQLGAEGGTVDKNMEPGMIRYLPWLHKAPKAPKAQRLKSRAITMMAITISWGSTDIYYKLLVQVIWFWIKRNGFEFEFTLVFLVQKRLIV